MLLFHKLTSFCFCFLLLYV